MTNVLQLFVPHNHFGFTVTTGTWDAVNRDGLLASLPFEALARFGWLTLCGWSMIEYGTDGVLFAKEVLGDSE